MYVCINQSQNSVCHGLSIMPRLGLCCTFVSQPVKFTTATSAHMQKFPRAEQLQKLSALCLANARALLQSVEYCASQGIGGFTTDPDIVKNSVEELEYQAQAAELIGADVINIHAGGGYGNKPLALQRMSRVVRQLSPAVLERLTLENDDRTYTPADLVAFCHEHNIPLVYDVHHHRCLPDGLSVQAATDFAMS